jgi:hypothetical protein
MNYILLWGNSVEEQKKYIFKKWQSIIFVIVLIVTSFSTITLANTINSEEEILLTYNFESPNIKTVEIHGTTYERITLSKCMASGKIGEPLIPSKGANILLPPNSKVYDIQVTPSEKQDLGNGHFIEPMGKPIPISSVKKDIIPIPNENIYSSNEFYPGKLHTLIDDYYYRGYKILVLLLHPIQYNPTTGELFYYKNLDVKIDLIKSDERNNLYRGYKKDSHEITNKVDNPENVIKYVKESKSSMDDYELLILTSDSLKDGFNSLKEAHDEGGTPTIIKTLSDIGSSDLEDIRNYIIDAYNNWGIDYVLIGGDTDVFPAPILWVYGLDEETWPYETKMPSDLFYACLDGPYNYDGDDKWGEPTDGEGGGDVDLFADVYVGRACVGDTTEVNNFVTKTIKYLSRNPDDEYLSNACFVGEYLGDHGIATWGGNYLDQLINGSSDDNYTTIGISASEYNIDKLYDRDYPGNYWPSQEIVNRIEDGFHFINHLGHSNYDYNMRLVNYDVDLLTNDDLCFIYSQGCNAGGFDEEDCIAEYFNVKNTYGAFAGIWNARYGFFWSHSTDGDSQRFQREFWDAVFGENIPEIGKANHDSKEDNIPIIGRSMIRWCYYQTNLFGDPTLNILETSGNTAPEKPSKPNGPSNGIPFLKYEFEVTTTDPDNDNVYYKWDWGNGDISDWIGPFNSGDIAEESYRFNEKGSYDIKVKSKDELGAETGWSDSLTIKISFSRYHNRQNTNLRLFTILHIFFHQFF